MLLRLVQQSLAEKFLLLEVSSWREASELNLKILKQGVETNGDFTLMKNKEKRLCLEISARF